jgi:chitinase
MVIAEHVYEAQLIGRFFRWLVDGRMPAGYTKPSYQWVDEVLLGLGPTRIIVKEPE